VSSSAPGGLSLKGTSAPQASTNSLTRKSADGEPVRSNHSSAPNHRDPISGWGAPVYSAGLCSPVKSTGAARRDDATSAEKVRHCRHNDQLYYRLTQFKEYFNNHLNQQSFHLI